MGALAEWIVEFQPTPLANPLEERFEMAPGGWLRLAEGAYKECRGHAKAGTMNARPLESCVKRAHRMVQRSPHVAVRIRNIKTGEIIPADIFA